MLGGQVRPEGMGAIVFHGLWRGVAVLVAGDTGPAAGALLAPSAPLPAGMHDRQLVRLLANMVLAAEAQLNHAY